MSYYLWPDDTHGIDQFGSKGMAIWQLQAAGFLTPDWFVIPPEAFYSSLTHEEYEAIVMAAETATRPQLSLTYQLSKALFQDLQTALRALCPNNERVAVRSSSVEADILGESANSFLENFLFVEVDDVPRAIRAIWRSGFSDKIIDSRINKSLPPLPRAPAVIVQRMLNPSVSGTALGADPESGKLSVSIINSVYGLSTSISTNTSGVDRYVINNNGKVLEEKIADKIWAHVTDESSDEGVIKSEVPEAKVSAPSLKIEEARTIAFQVRKAGREFGKPQEISWAIEDDEFYLLSSRPILSIRDKADPEATPAYWSTLPTSETCYGITTPLTYSIYSAHTASKYQMLCRRYATGHRLLKKHGSLFHSLTGNIDGRIYTDLLNLRRIASLVPGSVNRQQDVERFFGINEEIPEHLRKSTKVEGSRSHWNDWVGGLRFSLAMALNRSSLSLRIKAASRRIVKLAATSKLPLEEYRIDQLVQELDRMEVKVQPLLLLMAIVDGKINLASQKLADHLQKGTGEDMAALLSALVASKKDGDCPPTTVIAKEIGEMLSGEERLIETLKSGTLMQIEEAVGERRNIADRVSTLMKTIKDRCPGDLKVESRTYQMEPLMLWRSLAALASQPTDDGKAENMTAMDRGIEMSNAKLKQFMTGTMSGAGGARAAARGLRKAFAQREQLRWAMSQYYGFLRRLFLNMGNRLESRGLLHQPRDILFLGADEIRRYAQSGSYTQNIRAMAASRRREFEQFPAAPNTLSKFEARGCAYFGDQIHPAKHEDFGFDKFKKLGIGCCHGTAEGRVRIVKYPGVDTFNRGEILVARFTDPGWDMIFAAAGGIVLEQPLPCSHSAVLIRSLRIPAIIAAEGATSILKDGEYVELNGTTGEIRRKRSNIF